MSEAAVDMQRMAGAVDQQALSELISRPNGAKWTILHRIAAVMRDVRGVGKHQRNQHANYNYAGHEAVTDALRDAFVKHGIVRKASVTSCTVEQGVVTLLVEVSHMSVDNRADCVTCVMPAIQPSQTKQGTVTAQQIGQAVSYAVKNVEFKLFALTGDDTPDSDDSDPEITYERPREAAPQNDTARDLAVDYLARFEECQTAEDVKALNDLVKANWDKVRSVPDFADHLVAARRKANKRIGG